MRIARLLLPFVLGASVFAQSPATELRFEVASVKVNTSTAPPSSRFPLGPGDAYLPGTLFSATNQPLINYIRFAFAKSQGELLRAPTWTYDETFDIQGRAAGSPSKGDMRLMVRGLLADRFKLAWHIEQHEEPVLELVLAKSGEVGPNLTPHALGPPCGPDSPDRPDARFHAIPCGSAGLVSAAAPGRASISGRGQSVARLAALLSNNSFAGIDRVVVDRTGLTTDFDFTVDWSMSAGESLSRPVTDDTGPGLGEALRQQLGLLLRPTRALVDVLVIDHIEHPIEN